MYDTIVDFWPPLEVPDKFILQEEAREEGWNLEEIWKKSPDRRQEHDDDCTMK